MLSRIFPLTVQYALLLVIPIIAAIATLKIRGVVTPYYLLNYDPDYAYLFNSLSILDFLAPEYIDHPGTPVQLLGALIIKLMHPFEGAEQILHGVIEDPEWHLLFISNIFIGLNSIALLIAGTILLRLTNRIELSLLLQASPFMFPVNLISLGRVCPEPLLLFTSSVFVCLLLCLSDMSPKEHEVKLATAFGWAAGFGVTTKLTFIPMIFLPLTVLGSKILRKTYAIYFCIAAFTFTSIFLLYPKLYFYFVRWFFNLFLGSGIYGQGDRTIISLDHYVADLLKVALDQPLYLLAILLAIALYILMNITGNSKRTIHMFKPSLLLGLIVMHLIALLVVAKHPQSIRYLIPSLGLTGITLVVCMLGFEVLLRVESPTRLFFRIGGFAVVFAVIMFSAVQMTETYQELEEKKEILKVEVEKRTKLVEKQYSECAHIHQDSGTPIFAMFFGMQWSRQSDMTRNWFASRKVMRREFTFDPGRKVYYTMAGQKIDIQRIKELFSCQVHLKYAGSLVVL